ncbi:MAG: hypothetical protein M0019_01740 [Actinomycetota bacterium]|nr:hypothetical protein [Actinomycetota bacterium]
MDLSRYHKTKLPPLGELAPLRSLRFDTAVAGPAELSKGLIEEHLVEDEEESIYLYEISNRNLATPVRLRFIAFRTLSSEANGRIHLLAIDSDVSSLPYASAIGPISRMGDFRGQLHRLFVAPSPSVIQQVLEGVSSRECLVLDEIALSSTSAFDVVLLVSSSDLDPLSSIKLSSKHVNRGVTDELEESLNGQEVVIESDLIFHLLP